MACLLMWRMEGDIGDVVSCDVGHWLDKATPSCLRDVFCTPGVQLGGDLVRCLVAKVALFIPGQRDTEVKCAIGHFFQLEEHETIFFW